MPRTKEFDGGLLPKGRSEDSVYLGIDQSYSGFAICAYSLGMYHVWVHKPDGTGVQRLSSLRDFLAGIYYDLQLNHGFFISDVAMEGYAYGAQMAHMAGELGGMVKMTLLSESHYPLIVPPANLKKYVTGRGTGVQKNQMLLHVYKKWGVEFNDDNAADAYALARLVSGTADLAYEKEVVAKLQDPKFRERP